MHSTLVYLFLSFIAPLVAGHVGLFHESMFGRCGKNNACVNQAEPANPLQGLTFDEWWWHSYLDFPPTNDAVMSLPAGKSVTVQLSGNAAFTDVGEKSKGVEWPGGAKQGTKNESIVSNTYWNNFDAGNLHTTGHADVAGCALSIAYTDDAKKVRPEDMVIFSVQHECVWHRDTVFQVPANMPPCPNGKCMCSWWWIHNSNGGSDQMFQTAFQCNIVYDQGQQVSHTPVGQPVPPVNCEGDNSKCVKGPKLPMYWKQKECNNMDEPGHFAPTYSDKYGFSQGAQNDIFETINHSDWTCPQSKAVGVFNSQPQRGQSTPSAIPSSTQSKTHTTTPKPSSSHTKATATHTASPHSTQSPASEASPPHSQKGHSSSVHHGHHRPHPTSTHKKPHHSPSPAAGAKKCRPKSTASHQKKMLKHRRQSLH